MKQPFESCPRFDKCSVNVCPLDPDQHLRNRLSGEPKCTMAKSVRTRIGAEYHGVLPNGGETGLEAAGRRRWEAMPEAEKAARIEAGRALLKAARDTRICATLPR